MGAIGKGKTTTGVQIALELASQARIPFLFIDPKGEFVADGRPIGPFAGLSNVGAMEAGTDPVPLDFLPRADTAPMKIARAAMRLRDTLVLCCKTPGDLQRDLLRTAIERVITDGGDRNLETIRETYEHELRAAGKENDSIVSRLNELTHLRCFDAKLQPAQFFSQSWVVSLKGLPEELKRLVTLVLLDAVSAFLLDQPDSPVAGGFRSFRHLLVLDEARKVLKERRSESLVDLVRQGRSKGSSRPSTSPRFSPPPPRSCSSPKTPATSRARPTTSPPSSEPSSPSPARRAKRASARSKASSAASSGQRIHRHLPHPRHRLRKTPRSRARTHPLLAAGGVNMTVRKEPQSPSTLAELFAWIEDFHARSEHFDHATPTMVWDLLLRALGLRTVLAEEGANPGFREEATKNLRRFIQELMEWDAKVRAISRR